MALRIWGFRAYALGDCGSRIWGLMFSQDGEGAKYIYIYTHVCMYVCMCVCMYVCIPVCMYVCTYVCRCVYIYIHYKHACGGNYIHQLL